VGELPEATDTMVGERGLFRGGEPSSRQSRFRWIGVLGIGAVVPACSLVANLGQFDGAQLATQDSGSGPGPGLDAAEQPDSTGESVPEGSPDVTAIGDMDAGIDVTTASDDVVVPPDTSVDQGSNVDEASVEDAGDATTGPVYVEDAGPGMDGGPCMPNWPSGTNYVAAPDFEPGDPTEEPDGGPEWFAVYGGTYTLSSAAAFCGTHSGMLSNRGMFFHALGTNVPNGPATYNVAAWAMQDGDAGMPMLVGGVCFQVDGGTQYASVTTAVTAPPNTWVELTGMVSFQDWDCAQSIVFVGQPSTYTSGPFNDMFVDEAFFGQ